MSWKQKDVKNTPRVKLNKFFLGGGGGFKAIDMLTAALNFKLITDAWFFGVGAYGWVHGL
jgi:hypothetical protein